MTDTHAALVALLRSISFEHRNWCRTVDSTASTCLCGAADEAHAVKQAADILGRLAQPGAGESAGATCETCREVHAAIADHRQQWPRDDHAMLTTVQEIIERDNTPAALQSARPPEPPSAPQLTHDPRFWLDPSQPEPSAPKEPSK